MASSRRPVVTATPRNLETAPRAFEAPRTRSDGLFVRNHGPEPRTRGDWRIRFIGTRRTIDVDLSSLRRRATRKLSVVLECAGNGRSELEPKPNGVPWGRDAVGCAMFEGVSLAPLLNAAGLDPSIAELVFSGADDAPGSGTFQRSLPLEVARRPDTLLAFRMNGLPLTREHGGPIRLVVPGWYGVASVKWLREVAVSRRPFEGKHQTVGYVFRKREDGRPDGPVREIQVNSRVVGPMDGATIPAGRPATVWGWAWSGPAPVKAVEVSLDGGRTWKTTRLSSSKERYAWRRWTRRWTPPLRGTYQILARATDATGAIQPLSPVWNELGYANNSVSRASVNVR